MALTHEDIDALEELVQKTDDFIVYVYDFTAPLKSNKLLSDLYQFKHRALDEIEKLKGAYNGD